MSQAGLLTDRAKTLYSNYVLVDTESVRQGGLCGCGRGVYEAGDPIDVVKLIDVDEPRDPGPGQVLIRVTLFPITANWRPPRRITREWRAIPAP